MKKVFVFLVALLMPLIPAKALEKVTLKQITDQINNGEFFQSEMSDDSLLEASYEGNTTSGKIKVRLKGRDISEIFQEVYSLFGLEVPNQEIDRTVECDVTSGVIRCDIDTKSLDEVEENEYDKLIELMSNMVVDYIVSSQILPESIGEVYGYKDGAVMQMFLDDYLANQVNEFTLEKDGFEFSTNEDNIVVEMSTERPTILLTDIVYKTHVQNIGWQGEVHNGQLSGTTGKSFRLEGINIDLRSAPYSGNIEYRTHIQNIGWEKSFKKNGEMSGTSGKSLRLEAIQIKLTGEMSKHYDVYYRVHAEKFGWLDWAKNGESAGTEGYSYRLEAIEIKLVEKGGDAPGSIKRPFVKRKLLYQTHIQNIGWQEKMADTQISGTTGKSLRLEGIKISLDNPEYSGNIEYRTHIQNIGWEKGFKKNGEMSGTSGKSYRLEAIQIKLTGEMSEHYDVYYRVHAEKYGWLDWAKNGESSGTAGYSYRLEAIDIRLVEKGGEAPGKTDRPFVQRMISYQTHVQNVGWQEKKYDGEMSGTSGKSLRLEGIKIKLENQNYSGNIEYKTHIQNIGWEKEFKKNGEMSGTSGKSYRLEAIQIKLTGEMSEHYDVYYRVHAEKYGWLDWAKNGENAGTIGYSYRLEGIEIRLVERGEEAPGKTDRPFIEKNDLPATKLDVANVLGTYSATAYEKYKWNNELGFSTPKAYYEAVVNHCDNGTILEMYDEDELKQSSWTDDLDEYIDSQCSSMRYMNNHTYYDNYYKWNPYFTIDENGITIMDYNIVQFEIPLTFNVGGFGSASDTLPVKITSDTEKYYIEFSYDELGTVKCSAGKDLKFVCDKALAKDGYSGNDIMTWFRNE